MSYRPAISLLLCGFLFSTAPQLSSQAPGSSQQKSAKVLEHAGSAGAENIDVCALLTSAEIEAVQGEPIKETKPSEQHGGSFLMSQCFLSTPTFSKSVSLALAMRDPAKPSALTPREYWQKQFHPSEQEKEEEKPIAGNAKAPKEAEEERENELSKPRPVAGLGEEAYWVGNPITGVLYVLKGDSFLRISIGGKQDDSLRLKKAQTLAKNALGRLP